MKKILILANHFLTIFSLRQELIERLLAEKYKIFIVIPTDEDSFFEKKGCKVIKVSVDRHGINPIKDLGLLLEYYKIIKKISPNIVLSYTIKPNIYGGICCKILKIPILQNVTGLGNAVNDGGFVKKILIILYRIALNKQKCVFMQNQENLLFLKESKITPQKFKMLPGSGVNLSKYSLLDYPERGRVKFLFIARIMRSKGIEEFIQAAKYFKGYNTEFHVLGFCEERYEKVLIELEKQGVLYYHGMVDNVREYHKDAHCTVNPSYHEGMSNVLLEASACGRPCLCSDIPGCREIIDDGKSGFLFEAGNAESLIEAIEKFLKLTYDEQKQMGINARMKVERKFDRNIVVDAYIEEIEKITGER